jgi:hypothetical protein
MLVRWKQMSVERELGRKMETREKQRQEEGSDETKRRNYKEI